MEHTQIALTKRDAFMQAAEEEMAKFERQERDFRKRDREQRVAELHLPIEDARH